MDDLGKQYGVSSILCQALCIVSKPRVYSNWRYSPGMLNLGKNDDIFVPCDLKV